MNMYINKIALSGDSIKQLINKNSKIPPSNQQINTKVVHCYGCGNNSHRNGSIKCPVKCCNAKNQIILLQYGSKIR